MPVSACSFRSSLLDHRHIRTYPRRVDPERLRYDLPVENLDKDAFGDDESGVLLPGHPGRIAGDSPEDVSVDWFGIEDKPDSQLCMYDYRGLGELSEHEYDDRVERMKRGLPPV